MEPARERTIIDFGANLSSTAIAIRWPPPSRPHRRCLHKSVPMSRIGAIALATVSRTFAQRRRDKSLAASPAAAQRSAGTPSVLATMSAASCLDVPPNAARRARCGKHYAQTRIVGHSKRSHDAVVKLIVVSQQRPVHIAKQNEIDIEAPKAVAPTAAFLKKRGYATGRRRKPSNLSRSRFRRLENHLTDR